LLMILITLPFLVPFALAGLSAPIGAMIVLFGLRISAGKKPMIPQWFLRKKMSYAMLERVIRFAVPWARRLEKRLRPRLDFMRRWPLCRLFNGIALMAGGIGLMLPIPPPVPLTNTLPAIGIILLAAGLMEEDGVFILMGYGMTLAAWAYLGAIFWMGKAGFQFLSR